MSQQQTLQALSDEYSSLQTELTTLVQARQKLESQQQENKSVQKVLISSSSSIFSHPSLTRLQEFSTLSDSANIYKLVGPVLLKQDTTEAKSTVDGRLEYIGSEIKRVEGSIKEVQEKSEGKKMEIQSQAQQVSAGQA
ncbi:Prefoldin subunit [Teratosphaeria destructans]|uniref:Prefoldin subunit n=1 Tax=Teratosphaeria destructans TaxID=418781 RepID=A0A9W7W2U0_9PEZI|nr:Prefoldin subunit [Teratosphaeria destructans]